MGPHFGVLKMAHQILGSSPDLGGFGGDGGDGGDHVDDGSKAQCVGFQR